MEYLTLFPQKRALLLSDVDIILRTLPLQLNLRQFAFVMIVSSCRRVGLKTVPATEEQLSRLFSRYPLLPLPPSLLSLSLSRWTDFSKSSMNIPIKEISLESWLSPLIKPLLSPPLAR
jgi:hypothetical protein